MKINKIHLNLLLPILMNTRIITCEIHIKSHKTTSFLLSNGEFGSITEDDFGNYQGSIGHHYLSSTKNNLFHHDHYINHLKIDVIENNFGVTFIYFDNKKIIYEFDSFGNLKAQMGDLKCTSRENDFGTIYLEIFKPIQKNHNLNDS